MSATPSVGVVKAPQIPSIFDLRIRLSIAELATLAFFVYITFAALAFHLAAREFAIIVTLNFVTVATLMALRRNCQRAPWLAAAADLFPALLILVAYRESGLLLTPDPAHHLDDVFIRWDRVLLQNHFVDVLLQAGAPWLQHYLEFAYLLCYPLVPLGVAAIHFATRQNAVAPPSPISGVRWTPSESADRTWRHLPAGCRRYSQGVVRISCGHSEPADGRSQRAMDGFWAAVLPATLFCYAVYPFFPLTPPRLLFADVPGPHVAPLLRQWNFWLLDHYSVQACLFPSGHVAAVTAVALAVRKHAPRLGALFLFLAASVALATVYGRYHYTADAVAGALVGVAAYHVSKLFK